MPVRVKNMAKFIEVSKVEDGTRLMRWFLRHFPSMPQREFYKLCRGGQIRVNSKRVRGQELLCAGDEVRIPPTVMNYTKAPGKKTESGNVFSLADLEQLRKCIIHNDNDVVIRGRKNADIQITEDDIRIKAGVKVVNEDNKYLMNFNTKNPSYGKFKYHKNPLNGGDKSTATIVSDKIMLLSNTSPYQFKLTDREDLITDKEINKVLEEAYKLPYGEKLVELLNTLITAFVNHTHNYSMLPPNPSHTSTLLIKKAEMLDNGAMLSDTVRIN
jgi:hypothetical protein